VIWRSRNPRNPEDRILGVKNFRPGFKESTSIFLAFLVLFGLGSSMVNCIILTPIFHLLRLTTRIFWNLNFNIGETQYFGIKIWWTTYSCIFSHIFPSSAICVNRVKPLKSRAPSNELYHQRSLFPYFYPPTPWRTEDRPKKQVLYNSFLGRFQSNPERDNIGKKTWRINSFGWAKETKKLLSGRKNPW